MTKRYKFEHNCSDAEIRSIFTDFMKAHGLIFDGKDLPIFMDGKKRYVKTNNRSKGKKNSRSGWYSGRLGDFPNGTFGWFHGDQPVIKWSLYQHFKDNNIAIKHTALTPEEAAAKQKQEEREARRRASLEKKQFDFSKALTIIEWERSNDLRQHPYISNKRFSIEECQPYARLYNQNNFTKNEIEQILNDHFPEYNKPSNINKLLQYQEDEIKYRGLNLIIKGQLIDGTPIMHQLIFNKKSKSGKNKHFPKDLLKHKSFLNMGRRLSDETPPSHVIICEGWATGISLVRITNNKIPILVAWDSGNMRAVAKEVRKAFRKCKIYSANDNDHTNEANKNAGVNGGYKLCNSVGGYMLTPPFDSNNPSHQALSDWNDFDAHHQPHETHMTFRNIFLSAELHPAIVDEDQLLYNHSERFFGDTNKPPLLSDEFQVFVHAIFNLNMFGFQHCDYSLEEQKAMLSEEIRVTELDFKTRGIDGIRRIYDPKLDCSIIRKLYSFTNEISLSETNLMTMADLFQSIFKELQPFQSLMTETPILRILKDIVSVRFGEDLATLCLKMFMEHHNYFQREIHAWQSAVLKKLKDSHPEIPDHLLIPSVILTKEYDYWDIPSRSEREKEASDRLFKRYRDFGDITPPPTLDELMNQIKKIKYLNGEINEMISSKKSMDNLKISKIIDRINQTENCQINISDIVEI